MELLHCMIKDELSVGTAAQVNQIIFEEDHVLQGLHNLDSFTGFGLVHAARDDVLLIHVAVRVAFEGLKLTNPELIIRATPCMNLEGVPLGTWIGFQDAPISMFCSRRVHLDRAKAVWVIPHFEAGCSFQFTHVFSGAFCGWDKAIEWLGNEVATTRMAIDADDEAVQSWTMQSQPQAIFVDKKLTPNDTFNDVKIGLVSDIADASWMNACVCFSNHSFTLSPPCQSWSQGGLGEGLDHPNGMTLIHALAAIGKCRPVSASLECVDAIVKHPHYKIVTAILKMLGYTQAWMQIVPSHELSHMYRTRWLSVWVRNDCLIHRSFGRFKLFDGDLVPWNHPSCDLFVPDQVQHQLLLNDVLTQVYGSFALLPRGMKSKCTNPASIEATLKARCIDGSAPMPTLCASYGSQHTLSKKHLRSRGIFASLVETTLGVAFIDPMRCVNLLGANHAQATVIPTKITKAFAFLGNSISVPHALLCIMIQAAAVASNDRNIMQAIIACWHDRIKANQIVVLRNADWIFVCPLKLVVSFIKFLASFSHGGTDVCVLIGDCRFPFHGNLNDPILGLVASLGIEKPTVQKVSLMNKSGMFIDWGRPVHECFGEFILVAQGMLLDTITILHVGNAVPSPISISSDESTEDFDEQPSVLSIAPVSPPPADHLRCKITILGTNQEFFVWWPASIGTNQIGLRIAFLANSPLQSGIPFWFESRSILDRTVDRHFLVHPHGLLENGETFIGIVDPGCSKLRWVVTEQLIAPAEVIGICSHAHRVLCNGVQVDPFKVIGFHHGDCIKLCNDDGLPVTPRILASLITPNCDRSRIDLMSINRASVGSDEMWCGWTLIERWFQLFLEPNGVDGPFLYHACHKLSTSITTIVRDSLYSPDVDHAFVEIAVWIRLKFLISTPYPWRVLFGCGTEGDQVMQQASASDPWLHNDPWAVAQRQQCRWDDLRLPEDHGFYCDKTRMKHIHRHQLNSNVAGICFCTKSAIPEILQRDPKEPWALLIPTNDKFKLDPGWHLKASEPIETIVADSCTGAVYKRQVTMLQKGDSVKFSLPTPSYSATLTVMCELVLELHVKLVSKEVATLFADKPLDAFRSKVAEQFSHVTVAANQIYGIRTLREGGPTSPVFAFQALCKISGNQRKSMLEHSGTGDLIARDFVNKGETISDLTIIPRFWPCERNSKAEILRAAAGVRGFAGVAVVRKGLTVRSWCDKVADMRRRCYRSLGVTSWTLSFQSEPSPLKFVVKFNDISHEILLTKVEQPMPSKVKPAKANGTRKGNGKAGGKGSSKDGGKDGRAESSQGSQPRDELLSNTNDRLSHLESRFSIMERRQDALDTKFDSKFESISDQLRQIIHTIQPRAASPSKTGYTPPPKAHKSA
eukprot:Skav205964  [mRNA]  locus=scaffold442:468626:473248:+ [translate_table: standard]